MEDAGKSGAQLAVKVRRIAGKDIPIIIQTSYEHDETELDMHLAAVNKVRWSRYSVLSF